MRISKSWTLSGRQLCDVEMIMDGSFAPLNGFMSNDDYLSALKSGFQILSTFIYATLKPSLSRSNTFSPIPIFFAKSSLTSRVIGIGNNSPLDRRIFFITDT